MADNDMDLKVVGAGHLGIRVALIWKGLFPDAKIYLKSRSDKAERSAQWAAAGFHSLSKEQEDSVKVPYVVFSAPPTGNPQYSEDVANAITNDWSKEGGFVFTGSGGIFTENCGATVNEQSSVGTTSDRSILLMDAEKAVTAGAGVVIRFAGLYTRGRGPHSWWLKGPKRESPSAPNGLINLIHYDDAARCVVAALQSAKSEEGKIYVASDGVPISRVDICKAAAKCPDYQECSPFEFQGDKEAVDGKRYDTTKVRSELKWKPQFASFDEFMSDHYSNEMTVDDTLL